MRAGAGLRGWVRSLGSGAWGCGTPTEAGPAGVLLGRAVGGLQVMLGEGDVAGRGPRFRALVASLLFVLGAMVAGSPP